jgi:hypothetical protein
MSQNLSYQQRRAARLDDPSFENLRNPRARRRLAYSLIALLVVEAALFAMASILNVVLFVAIVAVLAFVMVMLLGALKASTRGIEELSPDVLDERQTQLRGEIFKQSYWVLAAASLLACALIAMMGQPWWALPDALSFTVIALMLQVTVTIPTLVTALRVRV